MVKYERDCRCTWNRLVVSGFLDLCDYQSQFSFRASSLMIWVMILDVNGCVKWGIKFKFQQYNNFGVSALYVLAVAFLSVMLHISPIFLFCYCYLIVIYHLTEWRYWILFTSAFLMNFLSKIIFKMTSVATTLSILIQIKRLHNQSKDKW